MRSPGFFFVSIMLPISFDLSQAFEFGSLRIKIARHDHNRSCRVQTRVIRDLAEDEPTTETATRRQEYFVSEALFVHLGAASQILTEAFYGHRTNIVTFQVEKLKTVLSLESTFHRQQRSPMGRMFVACSARTGRVLGFVEVDTCSLKNERGGDGDTPTDEYGLGEKDDIQLGSATPRPYMYNLAIDKQWKRKGIATSLVEACERFVFNIEGEVEKCLYLRVLKSNVDAIAFYQSLGYAETDPESISLTTEDVNSGSAEEGELILMAKVCE